MLVKSLGPKTFFSTGFSEGLSNYLWMSQERIRKLLLMSHDFSMSSGSNLSSANGDAKYIPFGRYMTFMMNILLGTDVNVLVFDGL